MRTERVRAMVASVENSRVRLVVEVETGEPVCGTAGREGEPQVPFEGMLGFLSLFDRLRQRESLEADATAGERD